MIPRRKVPVRSNDVIEWIKTLYVQAEDDVTRFEHAFRNYLGCKFALTTASGRDALELALNAMDVRPEHEVIIPAYTLGELLPLINATVVPVDIEKETFNMDIKLIERKITPRTKVILATHLLGAPCDIVNICQIAQKHGIWVIEDCAHALGASVSGQKVGTFGHAAIFSLEVNKAISTYGGGILVTNDNMIAASVSNAISGRRRINSPALRKALFTWLEEMVIRSPLYAPLAKILFSEKMSKKFERFYRGAHHQVRTDKVAYSHYQARMGLKKLKDLDKRNERLNNRWHQLAKRLSQHLLPQNRHRMGHPAFYNFVCLYDKDISAFRRKVSHLGLDVGIGSEIMDDCARLLGATDCPVAASVYNRALLLPLYEDMTERDFDRLLSILAKAL